MRLRDGGRQRADEAFEDEGARGRKAPSGARFGIVARLARVERRPVRRLEVEEEACDQNRGEPGQREREEMLSG